MRQNRRVLSLPFNFIDCELFELMIFTVLFLFIFLLFLSFEFFFSCICFDCMKGSSLRAWSVCVRVCMTPAINLLHKHLSFCIWIFAITLTVIKGMLCSGLEVSSHDIPTIAEWWCECLHHDNGFTFFFYCDHNN